MPRSLLSPALILFIFAGCTAPRAAVRELDTLKEAPLHTFTERELDIYLVWLHRQPLTPCERAVLLARQNLGQPYQLFLLGEYPFELHDPDPMVCLSAGDCVTFVEHTWAMALSRGWSSFFRTLQRIRYRNGEVGILTRNHFTSGDWNPNNAWLFTDITHHIAGDATRRMRVRIDRARFFKQYDLGQTLPVEILHTHYLPRDSIAANLDCIEDADILEIVKGNDKWQYISHMGLLLRDDTGQVTLIHSTKPAAREEPLIPYIEKHPNILGIKILRLRHPR